MQTKKPIEVIKLDKNTPGSYVIVTIINQKGRKSSSEKPARYVHTRIPTNSSTSTPRAASFPTAPPTRTRGTYGTRSPAAGPAARTRAGHTFHALAHATHTDTRTHVHAHAHAPRSAHNLVKVRKVQTHQTGTVTSNIPCRRRRRLDSVQTPPPVSLPDRGRCRRYPRQSQFFVLSLIMTCCC